MRARVVVVAVLSIASALAGCGRRPRSTIAEMVPRPLVRFARFAQADLDCDHVDEVLYVLPDVVQVRGCGDRVDYAVGTGGAPRRVESVREVAAAQMACEARTLLVESPAPSVRGVAGCGRVARYDLRCVSGSCRWYMTAHAGQWLGLAPDALPAWDLPVEVAARPMTTTLPEAVDLSTVVIIPPPPAPP